MNGLATLGDIVAMNARLRPGLIGAADLDRQITNALWYARSCRLANALLALGLSPGDRFCVLAHNRIEWMEIYAAAALASLIAVPVNFRLTGREMAYVVQDCGARVLVAEAGFAGMVEEVRDALPVPAGGYVALAGPVRGWQDYETLIASAQESRPEVVVAPTDALALLYTSGTTGNPKGAIRSHGATSMLSLVTALEMSLGQDDRAMLVMPLCHANSFFFLGAFAWIGAPVCIYSRPSFDPEEALACLAATGSTFTSLVPTHYSMMLDLPAERRVATSLSKLMISSAPARPEIKREIMELFPGAGLYELYGSTETGYVTMLHPGEQFAKLGSVGRECAGSLPIRLLDPSGAEVPDGQPGELYSCNAYTFDGYWGLPEKTAQAFRGPYCSVGDIARRDDDGYVYLVDRKSNMIISGGENVYPAEVEKVLATHPSVQDVAVIGLPDPRWGERVHAVVVPRGGTADADDLLDWCRSRMAGFKRPRSVSFVSATELPRTATGKIQHAVLKKRHLAAASALAS